MRYNAQCMMPVLERWLLVMGIFVAFAHIALGLINTQYLLLCLSLSFVIWPMPRDFFVLMVKKGPEWKQPIFYMVTKFRPLLVVAFAEA